MKNKSNKNKLSLFEKYKKFLGIFLIFSGLIMIFLSIDINQKTDDVILNTAVLAWGKLSWNDIREPILALIAGGYILNIPIEYAISMFVLGIFEVYLGMFLILNRKYSLKVLFSLKYWSNFQTNFIYNKIKKRKTNKKLS